MSSPPVRTSVAAIVRKAFPWIVLAGPKVYRVHEVHEDGRVDLVPNAGKLLPPLPNVEQWMGVAGGEAVPKVGSRVVVEFLDNDETTPAIRSYQPLRQAGGVPDQLSIDSEILRLGASATLLQLAVAPMGISAAVARVGDAVSLGSLTAVAGMVPVTFTLAAGVPSGTISLVGVITEGSSKVRAG